MFRFEDPIYLYALVLIPVLALIRWWMVIRQRRRLSLPSVGEILSVTDSPCLIDSHVGSSADGNEDYA